jgi:predicted RNase H-like HicB family nuclease
MPDPFGFIVVLEPQPEGDFTVSVPALPGGSDRGRQRNRGHGDAR